MRLSFGDLWCVLSQLVIWYVSMNQDAEGHTIPSRGFWKHDPLFSYLFIICKQRLKTLIYKFVIRGDLHGAHVYKRAPILSHILFADDCFLFVSATKEEVDTLRNVLFVYEDAFGKQVNHQKSEMFFCKNVMQNLLSRVVDTPQINTTLGGTDKYMCLSSMIGRIMKDLFKFIKDKVWKKIIFWEVDHFRKLEKRWW